MLIFSFDHVGRRRFLQRDELTKEETHLKALLDFRGRVRAMIMLVFLPEGLEPLLLSPLLLQLLLLLPELRSRRANCVQRENRTFYFLLSSVAHIFTHTHTRTRASYRETSSERLEMSKLRTLADDA